MRKIFCILFIYGCCTTFVGCRKAANRSRISSVQTETTKKEQKQERPRNRKSSGSVKKSDSPLSGSEIFRRYETAVFMVFTSDGTNNYQGSGFFIGKDGLAVSNYHVFEGTAIGQENIKL